MSVSAGALYLFKILNTQSGLTCSQVNCILKDSRGYMWFGTPAGLYRYDGYTFKDFQCNPQDGSSLPDSYIKTIQEGMDGDLWIKTTSGYCVYHPQTETFDRDMKSILSKMGISSKPELMFVDSHKNLWTYTPNRGVDCFNMQQQLLYNFGYTDTATGIPQGNIVSMGECKDGTVLVYDDGRIVCCDVMHQQHTLWANTTLADNHFKKNPELKVFADSHNNIWVYGPGTLICYNVAQQKWSGEVSAKLGLSGGNTDKTVNGMSEDKNGIIWIATDRNGLLKMNINSHEIEPVQPTSLNSNQTIKDAIRIQSVYVDDTNLLWVGTQKYGVAYSGKNIYKFDGVQIGDVTAITEGSDGKVWYGTNDNGVIGYDGPLASQKVSSMATTKDGSLWVGSFQNGLTRIKGNNTHIYSLANDSSKTVIDDHINDLATDRSGNLWIATNGGLQVFNPIMNTFSTYTKENGKLMSNDITSLFYAKGNKLLIGTADGLIIMKLSTNDMTYYTGNSSNLKTFTNDYITQVFQDSRGLIWIGTREGLNIYNEETDSLNYITEQNGLCSNSICGITEDKNSNVWVTTSNGCSRIVVERNIDDGSFNYGLYNYDTQDGLQSNEFNNGAILTKKNGQVVLGGIFGINWVRPENLSASGSLPRVMLTQLFIGDNEIETGTDYNGHIPLPQALNESNRIELRNEENTFTIKFAAGNYNKSERLQFIYWMEGLDDNWHNGDALKHGVTFNDLSSGSYTLHVKATSSDGSISNKERTIKIVIDRPWWLSWWMIIGYIIIGIVLFYIWKFGFKKFSDMWLRKKAIIKELINQRDEIKDASDDLRQPMARMTSIIGKLAEKENTIEGREQLNSLHSQVLQLITRISEMQISLDDPKEKAKSRIEDKLLLNEKGQVALSDDVSSGELTYEIKPQKKELPTKRFLVILIDDNEEFLRFMSARLGEFYTFETYSDINKADEDLSDLKADLVICKQDMKGMTGSELCNKLKMNMRTDNTKFVLMTDQILAPADIKKQGITLSADDYIAKPFNIQEAIMRFNKLLGIGDIDIDNIIDKDSIKGDDKFLEINNSSMTTANINYNKLDKDSDKKISDDIKEAEKEKPEPIYHQQEFIKTDEKKEQEKKEEESSPFDLGASLFEKSNDSTDGGIETRYQEAIQTVLENDFETEDNPQKDNEEKEDDNLPDTPDEESLNVQTKLDSNYSMASATDQQLMRNIEAYVMQNMGRGQLNMEEMAAAMGMGRVPFFHKIASITHKTPAELIRNLRLKHVCELLVRTNINMNEIALNVGFMTAENLITIFKEKFGVTPLEYRMEHRRK